MELQTEEESVESTLDAVVTAARENIPGVEYAGISLLDRGVIRTMAPSGEIVNRIDDLARETRWPRFGEETAIMGIRSMLSFRLFTNEDTLGALNLYAAERDAFDRNSEQIGELLAVHAAIALAGSQQESNLLAALDSRDMIGMAKGILMERHGVTDGRAFAIMVDASQKSQLKLHEVARWLVDEAAAVAGK